MKAHVAAVLASERLHHFKQALATHVFNDRADYVDFFHCVSDPHSHLALQALTLLLPKFMLLRVRTWIIPTPTPEVGLAGYSTDLERQEQWQISDCKLVASLYEDLGITFPTTQKHTSPHLTKDLNLIGSGIAMSLLAKTHHTIASVDTCTALLAISDAVLRNDRKALRVLATRGRGAGDPLTCQHKLRANAAVLNKKGHYMAGMFRYGYEWFWGIDRIHYLERQLAAHFGVANYVPVFVRNYDLRFYKQPAAQADAAMRGVRVPRLQMFYSFRSPYSQLCLRRVFDMCNYYGVELALRPVLPMVMRGLQVQPAKSRYIFLDAAREARTLGIKFGKACDPVGLGTERAFAVYHLLATPQGLKREFLLAFADLVWSRGCDAATDAGIEAIARAAGITEKSKGDILRASRDTGPAATWRVVESANRAALSDSGLWGVPSFAFEAASRRTPYSVRPPPVFGQDRIFAVEQQILAMMAAAPDGKGAAEADDDKSAEQPAEPLVWRPDPPLSKQLRRAYSLRSSL